MKNLIWVLVLSLAAFTFSSCDGAGEYTNTNAGNENANAGADPAKELATTLAETEKKAYEAWKKKDGKYFDDFLTDGFTGVSRNGRNVKAGVSETISKNPCEIKSYSTSDEEAVDLGDGIALLTMKVTEEVICDGKAEPSPQWAATIYVKDGGSWKAAYHQTVATPDAKGEYPAAPEGAGDKPADDADKEMTATLSEASKAGWEAWSKKDTKWFDENWGDKYVSITGTAGRSDRATGLKFHGEHKCEIKSIKHDGHRTAKISDNVVLFTYKSVDGACDGTAVANPIWASSIHVKDGEKWKVAFYMGTPGA